MKPKLLLLATLASLVGSIDCAATYAQRPGGPDAGGAAPAGESKPAPKPRTRWQKPVPLPEQYRSKDKDKDGQIGMYEWPRNDFATFRKLDLNHDGFLTAAELTRGSSSKSAPSVATGTSASLRPSPTDPSPAAAPATPKTGAEPAAKAAEVTAGDGDDDDEENPAAGKEKPATATAPSSNAGRSEAERQWDIVDKDKDGKVTEEEWGRSYLARPKFRDAGIAVSFPMTKEEFTQLWSQLPGTGK
jgi:hypothetical protein